MAKMDERLEKMVERYREINDLMMQVMLYQIVRQWQNWGVNKMS